MYVIRSSQELLDNINKQLENLQKRRNRLIEIRDFGQEYSGTRTTLKKDIHDIGIEIMAYTHCAGLTEALIHHENENQQLIVEEITSSHNVSNQEVGASKANIVELVERFDLDDCELSAYNLLINGCRVARFSIFPEFCKVYDIDKIYKAKTVEDTLKGYLFEKELTNYEIQGLYTSVEDLGKEFQKGIDDFNDGVLEPVELSKSVGRNKGWYAAKEMLEVRTRHEDELFKLLDYQRQKPDDDLF